MNLEQRIARLEALEAIRQLKHRIFPTLQIEAANGMAQTSPAIGFLL